MDSTPPTPPKRRSKPDPSVEDLPLFAPKAAPQDPEADSAEKRVVTRPPSMEPHPKTPPVVWSSVRTWLPVLALAMLIAGVWNLLPDGLSDGDFLPIPDHALPTVVIDAGHGGKDTGAIGNGLKEKDLTLDVAQRLERHLRAQGFPVVLTRRDDRYLELFDRAMIANKIPKALFVSVHFNDNNSAKGEGVETFYAEQKAAFSDDGWSFSKLFKERPEASPKDQGAGFARTLQMSMVSKLKVADRGAKPRQLAVVRLTRCPAVLVEGGFLNNPVEAKKIAQEDYRERLAEALADGVGLYFRHIQADALSAILAKK